MRPNILVYEILLLSALIFLLFFLYSSPPELGWIVITGLIMVTVALAGADFLITFLRKERK